MLRNVKKSCISLSLLAGLILAPNSALAASGSGAVDGLSESSSSMIEDPNIEKQLNRINVGVNILRVNNTMLKHMPVSEDAVWVEGVTGSLTTQRKTELDSHSIIKDDPFYSTVRLTDMLRGGQISISVTPMGYQLYNKVSVLYGNNLPDLFSTPNITDIDSYVEFPKEKPGKIITVEAKTKTLHKNVEDAVISLAPKDMIAALNSARSDYNKQIELYLSKKSEIGKIEAWLDDDKNKNSPEKSTKKSTLEVKKAELSAADKVVSEKEEIYSKIIDKAALAIESNFDPSKIVLAKKLEKVLDSIDDGAIGALSLFTAATAHIIKNGLGSVGDELKAINSAQALAQLVGNQKAFLQQRYSRMATGAIYALPNIGIGTYYAFKQIKLAGKYQVIVDKVIEGGKAMEKAKEKAAEAKK